MLLFDFMAQTPNADLPPSINSATLLTLLLGAMIPFLPKIGAAITQLVESIPLAVDSFLKERAVRTTALEALTEQIKVLLVEINKGVEREAQSQARERAAQERERAAQEREIAANARSDAAIKTTEQAVASFTQMTQQLVEINSQLAKLVTFLIPQVAAVQDNPPSAPPTTAAPG